MSTILCLNDLERQVALLRDDKARLQARLDHWIQEHACRAHEVRVLGEKLGRAEKRILELEAANAK